MSIGEAPGKVILLGEHAVVHGHPALAAPVHQVRARAEILDAQPEPSDDLWVEAPDIGLASWLRAMDPEAAIPTALRLTQTAIGSPSLPAVTLRLTSTIPVAAGLGSGAAITLAIVRALSEHAGRSLPLDQQSAIVFEVDKVHHGTPSGIDNTVITYGEPIRFQAGAPARRLQLARALPLLIADSGVASPTGKAVAGVRQRLQQSPAETLACFEAIHRIVDQGTAAVEQGQLDAFGACMNENQSQLRSLGVSSPPLERLVEAAIGAGALGAKLSGAGLGGNVVVLVRAASAPDVADALRKAGARRILETEVPA